MSWRAMLLGVLAAACVLASASTVTVSGAAPQRVSSDQQILIQLERDWDAAFHRNDVAVVRDILAEEFLATYDDGTRGDKAQELKFAAEFNQKIESSTLDDFIVKIYGDTAVVWFTQKMVGTSKGQRLELTFRYVDVFVQRGGRWQCVASQSTKVTAS